MAVVALESRTLPGTSTYLLCSCPGFWAQERGPKPLPWDTHALTLPSLSSNSGLQLSILLPGTSYLTGRGLRLRTLCMGMSSGIPRAMVD